MPNKAKSARYEDNEENMLTHEEMVGLQAEKHDLISTLNFRSKEEYVLHLMHSFAYVQAMTYAKDRVVLDLGCNTGYGAEILSRSAKKVIGVDVSQEAISAARRQHGDLGIEFQLIDGKRLPFEDGEFDLVISCQVVEHIVDYEIYFNELKRVLSPIGIALFTTPNALLRLDPGMKPWNPFHVREFDHASFKSLLERYFSNAQIMGLFAQEELYLIEKSRTGRAREAARIRRHGLSDSLRLLIKKIMPDSLVARVRSAINSNSHPDIELDSAFIDRYSVEDFFYRTEEMDGALDLLAICNSSSPK
jgi:ubiquinone/menaquinone biosynthesis C-methylase UbiE